MKTSVLLLVVLCAIGIYPTESFRPWFTASFYDLKFTLQRYGHCVSDLAPLKDFKLNETEYLIHHIENFLDQGNYEHDQLTNVSLLMDQICRLDSEQSYPIPMAINVDDYDLAKGKGNRCRSIDDVLDAMYPVFKRAALNHSEPLDFSTILFYPNITDKSSNYNLTDLINVSWIKSEALLEHVCNITDSVKRYVQLRTSIASNATSFSVATSNVTTTTTTTVASSTTRDTAQKRVEQQSKSRVIGWSMVDMIGRLILDPILGLQRRLAWESSTNLEKIQVRLGYGYEVVRDGFGSRIKSTRGRLSSMFNSGSSLNATRLVGAQNATQKAPMNVTQQQQLNKSATQNFNFTATTITTTTPTTTPLVSTTTTVAPTPLAVSVVATSTTTTPPAPTVSVSVSTRVVPSKQISPMVTNNVNN